MIKKTTNILETIFFAWLVFIGVVLITCMVAQHFNSTFQTAKPEQIITVYKNPTINIPVVYQIPFTNKFIHKEVKPYGVRINYDTGYLEHYLILENDNVYTTREIAIKSIGGN
jgi:hypothetical protein